MKPSETLLDDLSKLAESAFNNLIGARHEMKENLGTLKNAFANAETGRALAEKLGLVRVEEFDALLDLVSKLMAENEEIKARLKKCEPKKPVSKKPTPVKTKKVIKSKPAKAAKRLPSVKQTKKTKKR